MWPANSTMLFLGTALVLFLFSPSSGHLCLLNPTQRAPLYGVNKPASPACAMLTGPCGYPAPKTPPVVAYRGGQMIPIVFQKNLDHYYSDAPGYFSISGGKDDNSTSELARVADTSDPSLHLYTVNITLPNQSLMRYSVQVRYVTKNPKAPAQFYQCADFQIFTNA